MFGYSIKFLLAQAKQDLPDHDEQLIIKICDDMIDHLTDRYDVMTDNIKGDSIAIGLKKQPSARSKRING